VADKYIKTALIVDDEPDLCELAEITLSRMGLATRSVQDTASARNLLAEQNFDLCLTDMNLPDGNGIELVEHIQQHYPNTPVAMITAYGNVEAAVKALKAGAFDFVSKPIDLQVLRKLVNAAISLSDIQDSIQTSETRTIDMLLGDSAVMQELRQKITKLARSQAPVFIHGESGSGKELVAQLIHTQGARASRPFVPVNCGAIPSELMESEFFGHKKGSFTGASSDKTGLFKAADGGTLFLDEVADLPLPMQVKLLRAIQEKAIRPVGEHQEQPVDVRILSASHKNLGDLVAQGKFRQDLFYRINVIELEAPPLRQHREDIPHLARHLLQSLAEKSGQVLPRLSSQALSLLTAYDFPGNVRELENILERALALAESNVIEADDIQLPKTARSANIASSAPESAPRVSDLNLLDQEKSTITEALEQTRWNKTAAARRLGLSLRQLRYRMDKLGL